MTCCYLLSLPELPHEPTGKTAARQSSLLGHDSLRQKAATHASESDTKPAVKDEAHSQPSSSPASPQSSTPVQTSTSSSVTSLQVEGEKESELQAADLEAIGIAEKLRSVFDLHTKQRMKPGVNKRGVSIPSQQRFVHYWSQMLVGQDPRPFKQKRQPRKARIRSIKVHL